MLRYVLIASESPREQSTRDFFALGASLAGTGPVTLFLVQNGVLAARAGGDTDWLASAREAGLLLLADDFSLRERAVHLSRLAEGVRVASLDTIIDELLAGARVLWH